MPEAERHAVVALVKAAQAHICGALAHLDPTPFVTDRWRRPTGGGGVSRVLSMGSIFEKAGVNISEVYGTLSAQGAGQLSAHHKTSEGDDLRFFAAGLSLVIHPVNPMAPTLHANVRYFERGCPDAPSQWWFGGGIDLTPSYLFDEDAEHFHRTLKGICDRHDAAYYAKYKAWCDRYFYLPHRNETRGIGGIFFDHLNDRSFGALLKFVADVAYGVTDAYVPIMQKRHGMRFEDAHKRWQQLRRGRYVEFNLVYDRGTTFGLKTDGRIESILVSLPLTARWEYNVPMPGTDTPEGKLMAVLRAPRDWA